MFSYAEPENPEPNKQTKIVNWAYHQRNMVPSVTKLTENNYIYQKFSNEFRGIQRNSEEFRGIQRNSEAPLNSSEFL